MLWGCLYIVGRWLIINKNKIIDCKLFSEHILNDVAKEVEKLKLKNIYPSLDVILVGDDEASKVYVKNKMLACQKCGILSQTHVLSAHISQNELENTILQLNQNSKTHGILLQLPLPKHLDVEKALEKIDYLKDVDGFHIVNSGNLFRGNQCIFPCTPSGILAILDFTNIDVDGKHVVVVGRSNIVGKPLALMLLAKNATVTICHSKTQNLKNITTSADILISAVGKANFFDSEMIKKDSVLIDVGINRVNGKLCGDFNFESCYGKALKITPVPGGVGKMTIAMLMSNVIKACKMQECGQ